MCSLNFDGIGHSLELKSPMVKFDTDFVLAISKENPTVYFQEKGFETIIPYQEMILS
jgi:hypothetical protein